MTIWTPSRPLDQRPLHSALTRALAADIASGRLPQGARLPPQRDLAAALGVTVGTVTRAYAEAARRGLVQGEVGRGTFVTVRGDESSLVDLSLNAIPPYPFEGELMASLDPPAGAARGTLIEYPARGGAPAHRELGSRWLRRRGLQIPADQITLTVGAQHAILTALAITCSPGSPILVETLTFGGMLAASRLLGLHPHPVAIDSEGLDPDALDRACRTTGARTLYIQPSLHNPTGASASAERRAAILEVVARHGLTVVEDDVYGFLVPERNPLCADLEGRWCLVTSLSKSVAGGLRVGWLAVSRELTSRALEASWATVLAPVQLPTAVAGRLIEDGTAGRIVAWKRAEMRERQALARRVLPGVPSAVHPASPHAWLPLPRPWRSAAFI